MQLNKSDLIVIASAKAQPGKANALKQALLEAADPTRMQSGCVSFSLFHSKDDPNVIVGFERWASEEAHNKHLQGPHIQTLMMKMGDILAEPPNIVSYSVTDEV